MSLTRPAAPTFQLGIKVWRVTMVDFPQVWGVSDPARVTTVIQREGSTTYYLTTCDYRELAIERLGDDLFTTKRAAQAEADARHNDELEAQMKRHADTLRAAMRP